MFKLDDDLYICMHTVLDNKYMAQHLPNPTANKVCLLFLVVAARPAHLWLRILTKKFR